MTYIGPQLRALDAINNSRLWMTSATLSCKIKALDFMNSFGLWMTLATLGRDIRALDAMKKSKLG